MVLNVVHIIVPEALKAAQDQLRRVAADGAVGRGDDGARRFFDGVDGQHRTSTVEHLPHQYAQLAKSNAAGHAFAARLRVAQLQNVSDISIGHRPGGLDAILRSMSL